MASAPNIEGTSNPDTVTGGSGSTGFGTVVAQSPTETLGFYGSTGVVQQSATGVTTVAEVLTLLKNLGLLGT